MSSSYHTDLTDATHEDVPLVRPTAVVVPEPTVAGAWTVAGDLDNDGAVELVQARLRERGDFHLLGHTGNLLGDGRQDLALCTNPGGIVWIYRNSLALAEPVPPGFGGNVTLY